MWSWPWADLPLSCRQERAPCATHARCGPAARRFSPWRDTSRWSPRCERSREKTPTRDTPWRKGVRIPRGREKEGITRRILGGKTTRMSEDESHGDYHTYLTLWPLPDGTRTHGYRRSDPRGQTDLYISESRDETNDERVEMRHLPFWINWTRTGPVWATFTNSLTRRRVSKGTSWVQRRSPQLGSLSILTRTLQSVCSSVSVKSLLQCLVGYPCHTSALRKHTHIKANLDQVIESLELPMKCEVTWTHDHVRNVVLATEATLVISTALRCVCHSAMEHQGQFQGSWWHGKSNRALQEASCSCPSVY